MPQIIFIFLLFTGLNSFSQPYKANKKLQEKIPAYFREAAAQYKVLMKNLPAGKFPKTFFSATGQYEFSGSGWWCSGFYPGSLLNLYQETKDTLLHNEAMRMLELLEKEQFNTRTHDLGFMMYGSYGNALRIHPKPTYRNILLNSAKSLSTRFDEKTASIRSWDSKAGDFLVIIDNMMNLKLLFWATQATGDSTFYKIAVKHANTTLQNHFRGDNSSFHVVNYDTVTGLVKQKKTAQGFADESAWARGQAWGLYGFTETYRETKNTKYLEQANKIAGFILAHSNLPADKIPYWDFHAPGIPNELRDASAAAIMASALIELAGYVDAKKGNGYLQVAETILLNLSSPAYRAAPGTNGGFILQHGVGHMPNKTEVDVPLTYADYYFIEAMKRYSLLKASH